MPSLLRPALLVAASVSLAACTGAGPESPLVDPDAERPVEGFPAYETFDPSGYDADPEEGVTSIDHDVPARVMEGTVNVPGQTGQAAPAPPPDEPVERQVDGYRVQIFNTASRDAAERVRSEADAWWQRARPASGAPRDMDLRIAYQQPYYRVRMGGFATREEADQALALVRQQYPDAFLVSDLVTVRR